MLVIKIIKNRVVCSALSKRKEDQGPMFWENARAYKKAQQKQCPQCLF